MSVEFTPVQSELGKSCCIRGDVKTAQYSSAPTPGVTMIYELRKLLGGQLNI